MSISIHVKHNSLREAQVFAYMKYDNLQLVEFGNSIRWGIDEK